ncbi:MAG: hypothetical protein IJY53_02335 [Akkermansia sp.]|nr:hypothetical protein [Akkermansia sp.]
MKNVLLSLKEFFLLLLVCAITYVCATTLGQGLTTAVFFEELQNLQYTDLYLVLGILFIALQLVVMRWGGYAMNMLLTLTSTLLFAQMVTIAIGPHVSMTASLHQLADSLGMDHPLKSNTALYWLIPLTWFLCLLGAKDQVRTFCTALVCYALWLVGTPLMNSAVEKWAANEEPALPQILDILTGADWMPAAVWGCFLLIFALIVGVLDALFPEKKEA